MWNLIQKCIYLYLMNYIADIHCITYLKGVPTPKFTTRKIPLEKWLEDNNLRLAPYGNKEFTKIFKQYKHIIQEKYYYVDNNVTDTSLGKYVQSLFFTSTIPSSRKPKKKEKIKMGKLKLVKENVENLEKQLAITSTPKPTTTEPSTTPYTGPTQRKSASPYFDPDYIYDVNWFLKPKKRLRRNVNEMKISKKKNQIDNQRQRQNIQIDQQDRIDGETGVYRLKRELNQLKAQYQLNKLDNSHKIKRRPGVNRVKRDLGKIVRRSTKRPYLSRRFKAQSIKKVRHDEAMKNLITRLSQNQTVAPEFIRMKQVLDHFEKNKLSTLFFVYNGVGYFGSVPPHVIINITTAKTSKPFTYEMGATQILGANIFNDEKKISPDVDIPNLNLNQGANEVTATALTHKEDSHEAVKLKELSSESSTGKQKKTRKKKDPTEVQNNGIKKTRVKRKTTPASNDNKNSAEKSNRTKSKKRKIRSLNSNEQLVEDLFPHFLYLIHHQQVSRQKRNVDDVDKGDENQPKLEDETRKLNAFERFKKFVKNKKESIVEMPRRARYIAREMYLDGKFFLQELKHVPSRIQADFAQKKEFVGLFWDIVKVFLPSTTEIGEKGGTTPETKIVDDPKQYVKNPEDYLTPEIPDIMFNTPVYNEIKETSIRREQTFPPKTARPREEKPTQTIILGNYELSTPKIEVTPKFILKIKTTLKFTPKIETTLKFTPIIETTLKLTPKVDLTPMLVTSKEQSTLLVSKQTYVTKILGPDYVPTHTREADETEKTTLSFAENVFKKVNEKSVFDKVEKTMKDKSSMNRLFENLNSDHLKLFMKDMNPGKVFKHLTPETMGRMGNLVKELDPDTLKKMQDVAIKAYGTDNNPDDNVPSRTN